MSDAPVAPVALSTPAAAAPALAHDADKNDDAWAPDSSESAVTRAGSGSGALDPLGASPASFAGGAGRGAAPRAAFSGAEVDAVYYGCPGIVGLDLLSRLSRAGTFPVPFKSVGDTDYTAEVGHGGRDAVEAHVLYIGCAWLQNLDKSLASWEAAAADERPSYTATAAMHASARTDVSRSTTSWKSGTRSSSAGGQMPRTPPPPSTQPCWRPTTHRSSTWPPPDSTRSPPETGPPTSPARKGVPLPRSPLPQPTGTPARPRGCEAVVLSVAQPAAVDVDEGAVAGATNGAMAGVAQEPRRRRRLLLLPEMLVFRTGRAHPGPLACDQLRVGTAPFALHPGGVPATRSVPPPPASGQMPTGAFVATIAPRLLVDKLDGNPPLPPPYESIRARLSEWMRIGASHWVLSGLRDGLKLLWRSTPPHSWARSIRQPRAEAAWGSNEIKRWVRPGFVRNAKASEVRKESWAAANFVADAAREPRLVVGLSVVNDYLEDRPFKYESMASFVASLRPGDHLVSWDISDAFHHVPLNPADSARLACMVEGDLFYLSRSPLD